MKYLRLYLNLFSQLQTKVDRCVMHYDNALQNSDQEGSGELEKLNDSVEALVESQKFLKNFCEVQLSYILGLVTEIVYITMC